MTDDELEALAADSEGEFIRRRRQVEDFRYDEQQEKYWDTTTGNLLSNKSVDGAIAMDDWPLRPDGRNGELRPVSPSKVINAIDTGLTVEGSTWWPGRPRFIQDVVVTDRGVMDLRGAVCYNAYVPPSHDLSRAVEPTLWIEHVKRVFPEPTEHELFFDYAAHMIQRPDEKVNWGLVLAGRQGVGKDTALIPLRAGVGEWNAAEVSPDAIAEAYNGYVRSVLLVINEVRPHDEDHKAANFYNQLKPILSAPPDMTPMTLKYANTIYVRNLCHVVLTTNDPLTMFIPEDDRRLMVLTSPRSRDDFDVAYFRAVHDQLEAGGTAGAIRWLAARDLSAFRPTEAPPMTAGKERIIESGNQVRRTALDDVFEQFVEWMGKRPRVFFHKDLQAFADDMQLFDDRTSVTKAINARNFHYKMHERGYDMVRNPSGREWRSTNFRTRSAFVDSAMPDEDRLTMVRAELDRRPLDFHRTEH
jgi:hypothetical protein